MTIAFSIPVTPSETKQPCLVVCADHSATPVIPLAPSGVYPPSWHSQCDMMYFLGDFFSPVCLSSCALLISQLILSVQVSRWLWVLHCIVTVIRSVLNAINYLHHRCIVDRDHKYTWFPLSLRTAIITCILPCDYSPFCANTTVEIGCSLPPRKRPPQLISHNSFTSLNSRYYIWTSLAGRSTYVMRTSPVLSLVKDSLCSYFVYRAPLLRREGQWKILLENPPPFFSIWVLHLEFYLP